MPLARAPPKRDPPERERVMKLISEVKNISVTEEQYKEEDNYHHHLQQQQQQEEDEEEVEIDRTDLWLVKYDELAQKTKNIPLSHLGCCREGGELFNDLCMWVDINQKYVELGMFPQWNDLARELNIDDMKTEWVKVCVRPEQSFTRAILEIYMNDGGTLGDVIEALRKQKQFRIIQEITAKAEEFMDLYNTYHKDGFTEGGVEGGNAFVYSILRTLYETFDKVGKRDPLNRYQQYSKGFKNYFTSLNNIQPADTDLVVNAVHVTAAEGGGETQDSGYTSPYRYSGTLPPMPVATMEPKPVAEVRADSAKKKKVVVVGHKTDMTMRVLLFFAKDGVEHAEQVVQDMDQFSDENYPDVKVDMFRLNEQDLWTALLMNPEACIQKWVDEMDFVMPILTPELVKDLHAADLGTGPPAPTCPMINKYIYNILRTSYVADGCQNKKVRPAMPKMFRNQLHKSRPVTTEPLFRMWKETDRETMYGRMRAMVKVWYKAREV